MFAESYFSYCLLFNQKQIFSPHWSPKQGLQLELQFCSYLKNRYTPSSAVLKIRKGQCPLSKKSPQEAKIFKKQGNFVRQFFRGEILQCFFLDWLFLVLHRLFFSTVRCSWRSSVLTKNFLEVSDNHHLSLRYPHINVKCSIFKNYVK